MAELLEVKSLAELQDTISANKSVVVEFGASWCGPCRQFLPHFKRFAESHDDIVCVKIDIQDDPAFETEYDIQTVPQVMLFEDGQYVRHLESRTVIKLEQELA